MLFLCTSLAFAHGFLKTKICTALIQFVEGIFQHTLKIIRFHGQQLPNMNVGNCGRLPWYLKNLIWFRTSVISSFPLFTKMFLFSSAKSCSIVFGELLGWTRVVRPSAFSFGTWSVPPTMANWSTLVCSTALAMSVSKTSMALCRSPENFILLIKQKQTDKEKYACNPIFAPSNHLKRYHW